MRYFVMGFAKDSVTAAWAKYRQRWKIRLESELTLSASRTRLQKPQPFPVLA